MAERAAMPAPTRVLVVDDHLTLSEALAMALGTQHDLECVGVAPSGARAIELVEREAPDVVLMDVRLPDSDGVVVTERIKAARPQTRVLVLTAYPDVDVMARAAAAGACGFLPKESPIAKLLEAVRTARDDGLIVGGTTLTTVLQQLRETMAPGHQPAANRKRVTSREREVLSLMGEGLDARAISVRLGITLSTARSYIKSILAKLGAHSQLEAVVTATRDGLIATR